MSQPTEPGGAGMARLNDIANDGRVAVLLDVVAGFAGGELFLVGGAVRDALIGRGPSKDLDVVVRGVSLRALSDALATRGEVNMVGKSFGVLKFRRGDEPEIDIAWPRTERAGMSGGYRDFTVQADPELPVERDLARRDFTVNAMAFDVRKRTLIDPHGGMADLAAKTIRAVGDPQLRFNEDHSRMVRAVRFACQLGFVIEPKTWEALVSRMPHLDDMRDVDGASERVVPYETVAKEFVKAMAADPARAATLFTDSGALLRMIPELAPLSSCVQSREHHSEGDVWTHTLLALSKLHGAEFAAFFPGEKPTPEAAIATLLHDVAKPQTAVERDGKWTFYGHDERGSAIARAVSARLRLASAGVDVEQIAWLVKHHLFPNLVDLDSVRRTTLAKYFLDDPARGRALLHLAFADASASVRPDRSVDLGTLRALLAAIVELDAQQKAVGAQPILSGDDVMSSLELSPGPEIGQLLDALKEAQLRGEVVNEAQAREFIRRRHSSGATD